MPDPIYIQHLQLSPDQPIVCIHHSDADGMLAADVLKLKFNRIFFISANYGRPVDYKTIPYGSIIFIVDFTIPEKDMEYLCSHSTVIWIDHHTTYGDPEYEKYATLEGIRSTECAACKLTWKYLFQDAPVPRVIQLSSDYDTWNFEDKDTLPLHYGLELFSLMPRQISDTMLRKIMYNDNFINTLILMGRRIEDYVHKRNKLISDDAGFVTEINGHKVVALNIRNTNSMVLDAMAAAYPDIQLRSIYGYNASIGMYKCSLYSDNKTLTCQEVDPRFKGHPTAAGYECQLADLPYKLPTHSLNEPEDDDIVSLIEDMNKRDPLIYRHDGSAVGGLCRTQGYEATFEGMPAYVVNHPYWSGNSLYTTNLITDYEIGVFWNLTKSGWYRYRIYPLELNRRSLEDLAKCIPGGKVRGNAVWCYRETPLESPNPPKTEQPRPFFNKFYNPNRRW